MVAMVTVRVNLVKFSNGRVSQIAIARRRSHQLADHQDGGVFRGCCRVSILPSAV